MCLKFIMTRKHHIVFLIVTIGFLLMPVLTYACDMKAGKSCCSKEMSSNSEKMDCCKNMNHSKNREDEGCKGKSKHSACSCSISHISVILPFEIKVKDNSFNFFDKKQKFSIAETNLSSGFYSLWLIPKIS